MLAIGYPMAQNLRAKIPETDTLIIHDQNRDVAQKFHEEVGIAAAGAGAEGKANAIEVSESPRDLAEKSVRASLILANNLQPMMSMFQTNDLSWEPSRSSPDSTLTSKPIL